MPWKQAGWCYSLSVQQRGRMLRILNIYFGQARETLGAGQAGAGVTVEHVLKGKQACELGVITNALAQTPTLCLFCHTKSSLREIKYQIFAMNCLCCVLVPRKDPSRASASLEVFSDFSG